MTDILDRESGIEETGIDKEIHRQTILIRSPENMQDNFSRVVIVQVAASLAQSPDTQNPRWTNRHAPRGRRAEARSGQSNVDVDAVIQAILAEGRRPSISPARIIRSLTEEQDVHEAIRQWLVRARRNRGCVPIIDVRDTPTFLTQAADMQSEGKVHAALGLIYRHMDSEMRSGHFDRISRVLSGVDVARYSVEILIGLLTATLPAKDQLDSRPEFFGRVEAYLRATGEYEDGLLSGLE